MYALLSGTRGCAMAQAVSGRPLTAEARVCARDSSCGICGKQIGIETGFLSESLVFPTQYYYIVVLHTHISSAG
jgi:hypothetical protein